MLFFLRFKAQLRRTRPDLVPRLEESLVRAVESAGGKITAGRRLLTAVFDEDSLGFWLDMLMLIESQLKSLDAAAVHLYGYALVLGRDLLQSPALTQTPEALCRMLAGGSQGGVFLDDAARDGLAPYTEVEERGRRGQNGAPERGSGQAKKPGAGNFWRLKKLKTFDPVLKNDHPLRDTMIRALRQGLQAAPDQPRHALIVSPAFAGKRDSLYRYCEELNRGFPLLFIRFGSGGINAITDAWSSQIRSMAAPGATDAEEINGLWELLFRERLREGLSPFILGKAHRFFVLLLEFYTSAARRKGCSPVLVLENIHLAEPAAAELFVDVYGNVQQMPGLVTLATCDVIPNREITEEALRKWGRIFPQRIRINAEAALVSPPPRIPMELWEIAYAFSLLGRYFPASLFVRLFEEEGKNPLMVSRALSLLSSLGIIDTPLDPRPWPVNFIAEAEAVLGARRERVRALTRNRLLGWVEQKKLSSCFRFLTILADLGGAENLDDQLILKSIASDLVNGTAASIEMAWNTGFLQTLAGPERTRAVRYIFETMRALLAGDESAIRTAFKDLPPDCAAFPVMRAQTLVNLSGYHLGLRDNASALETVKEAILTSQGKNSFCLAQAYRLLSLVSLAKQQTGETIDYLGFAMDKAEKAGDFHELGVSAYYAAAAQFLYGNISKAMFLARKAWEQSLAAGCPEWADRSRFLEGRLVFETGHYHEALDIFDNLRQDPLGRVSPDKDRLLAAWAYRSRVYFQNTLSPKPAAGGHDADLFEVEAAYLSGNYRKTVDLAQSLVNPHIEENFLYTEQPDWRSGFSQCELLYFSRGELWERMISVYHSLALCRLSAAGGEEAMHNMQRILKNEQLSEMDPWDAFYFYAWYRILEQTGAGQVDMNTAVSMAFKRLQRRASRIDDVETRREYLSKPRWNSALSVAARKFKLI